MPDRDRLTLEPEELRRLGYRAVDAIVERAGGLARAPVGVPAGRAEMEARLREPLPEDGEDPERVLDALLGDVLPFGVEVDHPRFFAYVPIPANPVGAIADALAAGFTVFAGTWQASPGAATVELVVLDWLKGICGFPDEASGIFVSGGSIANLTGLAVGLPRDRTGAVVYVSAEAHSSNERALRALGVPHVRTLAPDAAHRLEPAALAAAVDADAAAGLAPACLIASAGTTGTGAVDPLPALRAVCDERGLWLHVDGAYGAAAALSPAGRAALEGLELADSLTLDPHKWLFQPLEAGCVLVRDGRRLEDAFAVSPAYLRDTAGAAGEVNFGERGLQLTRQARALKLWMSLKVFGAEAFRSAIEHGLELAGHAEASIAAHPDFEVVTGAQLGIVTFRHAGGEAVSRALPAAMLADGFAYVTTTRVHGETVLRMCTINPRTTREDVERTIARLGELARTGHGAHS